MKIYQDLSGRVRKVFPDSGCRDLLYLRSGTSVG